MRYDGCGGIDKERNNLFITNCLGNLSGHFHDAAAYDKSKLNAFFSGSASNFMLIYIGHGGKDGSLQTGDSKCLTYKDISDAILKLSSHSTSEWRTVDLCLVSCYADTFTDMKTSMGRFNVGVDVTCLPTSIKNPREVPFCEDGKTMERIAARFKSHDHLPKEFFS